MYREMLAPECPGQFHKVSVRTGGSGTPTSSQLVEDEETGAKKYRYIRTGPDHFSLAFTYAWMAVSQLFHGGSRTGKVRISGELASVLWPSGTWRGGSPW